MTRQCESSLAGAVNALASGLAMQGGHAVPNFSAAARATLAAGKLALRAGQFAFRRTGMSVVFYMTNMIGESGHLFAGGKQVGNTQVHADGPSGRGERQRLNLRKGNDVPMGTRPGSLALDRDLSNLYAVR